MSKLQPLAHLDAHALQELIKRYYDGENVAALLKEFDVPCHPCALCKHFPPELVGRDCPRCGTPLVLLRYSRSRTYRKRNASCLTCRHQEVQILRNPQFESARQRTIEAKVHRELKTFSSPMPYDQLEITPQQLSAEAAVALLSLVRSGGWVDSDIVGPLRYSAIPFAPMESHFQQQLIKLLIEQNLVAPWYDTLSGTFGLISGMAPGGDPATYSWIMLVPNPPAFIQQLEILIASSEWPIGWREGCARLWRRLATAECWEFCAYCVGLRSLPMPGSTALLALLENLLRDFSVSQCNQLIWASAKEATDYRVRKHTTAQHAANYLVGSCQRQADRSRAEGWKIKGFTRNSMRPRSQISHVLHDVFYKHGKTGFNERPT